MKNILKKGIDSNLLKTIAVIAMVIDHIAFYFVDYMPLSIYKVLRYIGRIAMPIFVYLLVQGFFHTRNLKKYILRLGILAIVVQICITVLMLVNINFVKEYTAAKQVYTNGNILFSFVICLSILKLIHEPIIIKKWDYNKNLAFKAMVILLTFISILFIPLDYGIDVLVLGILFYYIEKLKIQILMDRQKTTMSIKTISLKVISEEKINLIYIALIVFSLMLYVVYLKKNVIILLAAIPIALYNGEKKNSNKIVKYLYYGVFALHHILLYSLAMIITLT